MECYKTLRRHEGCIYIIAVTFLFNVLLLLALFLINSYVLAFFLKFLLVIFNFYQLYFIFLCGTLKYFVNEDYIYIKSFFGLKKVRIAVEDIMMYTKFYGNLDAVRLSGYGKRNFTIGRFIVKKLGVINMFVTSSKQIFYIKTKNECYGISPEEYNKFEEYILSKNIRLASWEHETKKPVNLYKDKRFIVPFFIVSILILALTIVPLILYMMHMLPQSMPLCFNTNFEPTEIGTSKEFVFKQMIYGAYNMVILFCMYYTANFNAKYDRKSAYKYIYISLIICIVFLFMQFRILLLYI